MYRPRPLGCDFDFLRGADPVAVVEQQSKF